MCIIDDWMFILYLNRDELYEMGMNTTIEEGCDVLDHNKNEVYRVQP